MRQQSNYGVTEEEKKVRIWKNMWGDYSWKIHEHGKGNSHPGLGSPESPIQGKLKEKHAKTHINETNKTSTQRKKKNIKSNKGKATRTYKGIPIKLMADLSVESLQARREWQDIVKVMKGKNLQWLLYNEFHQGTHWDSKEKPKTWQTNQI